MIDDANPRTSFLHYIRDVELNAVLQLAQLPASLNVLDFGSGDGFLASCLSQKGFNVTAVDIAPRQPLLYPTVGIGEPELPFASNSFDFIFSSNALEHVRDRAATLSEVRRILKPDGKAVFTMPTPAWRLYTLLEIPVKFILVKYFRSYPLYDRVQLTSGNDMSSMTKNVRKKTIVARAIKYILRPHGEFPSSLHELITFSSEHWKKVFYQNGFSVVTSLPLPIIYGDLLFPWKWLSARRLLASRLTSSCIAYYVRKQG